MADLRPRFADRFTSDEVETVLGYADPVTAGAGHRACGSR